MIVEQASSLLDECDPVRFGVPADTLGTGLLTRIRLGGGSESASPDQRVSRTYEVLLAGGGPSTHRARSGTLLGRAAACS
jgi:hypothetical protein